jgi:hypothetical protein
MATSITQAELIRVFKNLINHPDDGCCFLLGAGASVSSGIPSGGELAKKWYDELKEDIAPEELDAWQTRINFDSQRIAEFYPEIFNRRFRNHPQQSGYRKLQELMENAEPSIGYSFLAQVLTETQHKFVITTNFDHMIEDSIRTYTAMRPLVIGHESLAQFVNTRSNRPTIIKVHRDLLLHPFNEPENTKQLEEPWGVALASVLQHYHLVVIGYGGNDGSLMRYLTSLQNNRKSIYWCHRKEDVINAKTEVLLKQRNDCKVEIAGFDELMYALNDALDYPLLIDRNNLPESKVVKIALEKAEKYKMNLEKFELNSRS